MSNKVHVMIVKPWYTRLKYPLFIEARMICSDDARRYRLAITLLFGSLLIVGFKHNSITNTAERQNVIHQLRVYEIFDHNKKAFHDRFRDHTMRIMARYGFKIVATWETKKANRTEFVYLIDRPNEETMRDRWAKFLADQEWSAIKKETSRIYGDLVGTIEDRTLELKDYSPRRTLAR
jgi:hypothetical protein